MIAPRPLKLLSSVTCPHCWHRFGPHQTLWLAAHPSLRGDPLLGAEAIPRFLPTRFAISGSARDELGAECSQLACPSCHLIIPRLNLELPPHFVSIIGASGCGKSYYLAALTRCLRRRMLDFKLSFTDTDAAFNQQLGDYEQQLFSSNTKDVPLAQLILKTPEEGGGMLDTVTVGTQSVSWPRPLLFTVRRTDVAEGAATDRVICLYDNAGESFDVGRDTPNRPVTKHLAKASFLLFLYDPTLDAEFRSFIRRKLTVVASDEFKLVRQDLYLTEMANRVRSHGNLPVGQPFDTPLIVVITKRDAWKNCFETFPIEKKIVLQSKERSALDVEAIRDRSAWLKDMLKTQAREIVNAADAASKNVTYIDVSVLGKQPTWNESEKQAVSSGEIEPQNVEIPLLYGLFKTLPGLIPSGKRTASTPTTKAWYETP